MLASPLGVDAGSPLDGPSVVGRPSFFDEQLLAVRATANQVFTDNRGRHSTWRRRVGLVA